MKFKLLSILLVIAFTRNTLAHAKMIFIPGAHFDGNSFSDLISKFPSSEAIDFPLPSTTENIKKVSLTGHAKRVCAKVEASVEDVVLVGHSQGGAVMNQSLGLCPRKIRALVYVAAVIPLPNELPFGLLEAMDDEYYFRAIQEDKESGLFRITDNDLFGEAFAQDSTIQQRKKLKSLARHEPISVSKETVVFERTVFDPLPKLVISTSNDRIITPKTQKMYYDRIQTTEIHVLDSGHLPMVTRVDELHKVISSFAKRLK